ncbi:hypothetical protein DPEC_G00088370 [Dallia pectoralis]|uniref:Uncharacterized protein n=1 Tax=Dallia pectoralis TaxID=75939 RepID=A0ACC2H017_DALPE|nr:hypothetical protein DPEC_G00088370 [Dallia pectoralis]
MRTGTFYDCVKDKEHYTRYRGIQCIRIKPRTRSLDPNVTLPGRCPGRGPAVCDSDSGWRGEDSRCPSMRWFSAESSKLARAGSYAVRRSRE